MNTISCPRTRWRIFLLDQEQYGGYSHWSQDKMADILSGQGTDGRYSGLSVEEAADILIGHGRR